MKRKTYLVYLAAAVVLSVIFPSLSHGADNRFTAQLDLGVGYFQDILLTKYVKTVEDATVAKGFPIVKSESLVSEPMNIYLDYHMRISVAENVYLGLSTGVSSLLSSAAVRFKRPVDGASMARTTIHNYLLPQSLDVSWYLPLRPSVGMLLGGGPAYYLTYTTFAKTVKEGVNGGRYENFDEKKRVEHAAGINAILEFVFYFNANYAFTIGVRGDFIFPITYEEKEFVPYVAAFMGIAQSIEF